MNEEELVALKYRQLQKIAKANGLKANLPKDALIKGILKCQDDNGDKTKVEEDETRSLNTSGLTKLESTISSTISSCSENEIGTYNEDTESKKLNETFEVKDSSILTNDEDEVPSNVLEKKTVSAFNTPTLMNASDRFEQFFGIDDEHIPVMASPKTYTPKHLAASKSAKKSSIGCNDGSKKTSFHNTPTAKLQQNNTPHKNVFARLSAVPSRRSSVACTPKVSNNEKIKPHSALKG